MLTLRSKALLVALTAALAPGASSAQRSREPYPGFDAYVDSVLRTWKVPGAAIAIVRNDSVIHARGYGVKERGKPDPVTERTIFAIGSSSKAFTAAGIAMLVDEKKVSLDAPAAAYLPGFQLFDPYATRELTVRDLLSHRSGLARGDLLWYGTELDRDEILRRVRFLKPSWSFRSQFGYQNLMYLAAGQVTARVSGRSWDDFMRERLLGPLGMSASSTSIRDLAAAKDVATPHAEIEDTVRVVPWRLIDNIAPAGSINAPVVDMARWLRLQLARGKFDGRQLISEKLVDEMHTPHTVVPLEGFWKLSNPGAHLLAYGLGWFLNDYAGRLVVHHGGNIDGMSALVAMLPEERLGVVILTNLNSSPSPYVIANRLWDMHLRTPAPRDWSAELRTFVDQQLGMAREAQRKAEAARVPNTSPSVALAQYAGTYVDSLYGEVRVHEEGGKLRIDRGPAFQGTLEHWHYDAFRARWDAPMLGRSLVNFRLDASGKVDELQMDMAGTPVSYRKKPEAPRGAAPTTNRGTQR